MTDWPKVFINVNAVHYGLFQGDILTSSEQVMFCEETVAAS